MKPLRLAALVLLGLASCGRTQGTYDSARQVRHALAAQLDEQGDWNAAFHVADALLRERPDDGRALLVRARALRRTGALAEAEADLRRLVAREPRNAASRSELALLLEETARPAEALASHREALRLAPATPRFANNLGFALLARGRPGEAIPILEEALRIAPADHRLRNNLGFAYAATGDFARAARQFALAGREAEAANNLGLAYERAGNLAQAYELYDQAVRLAPASVRARANLEHDARHLGRPVPDAGRDAPQGGS
jgi:Flp pilus assembly protein TadD